MIDTALRHPLAASLGRVLALLILLVAAFFVFYTFIHYNSINYNTRARLLDMIDGTAHRPFVYRTLAPSAIRAALALVPDSAEAAVNARLARSRFLYEEFRSLEWDQQRILPFLFAMALIFTSLLGFIFFLGRLFEALFDAPGWATFAVRLLALAALPPMFEYVNYIYDFPTLLLTTAGLLLMLRRRWGWYLALFALSCLNRETTLLLAVVFAIHFAIGPPRLPLRPYARLLAAQVVIFLAVKLILAILFRHAPGGLVEFHLDHTFEILTRDYELPQLTAWLFVFALVVGYWPDKPPFLRHAVLIIFPLLPLALVMGYVDELRIYYEVFPIAILMMAHSLALWAGLPLRLRA